MLLVIIISIYIIERAYGAYLAHFRFNHSPQLYKIFILDNNANLELYPFSFMLYYGKPNYKGEILWQ